MSKTILTKVDGWTPLIEDIVQQHGIIAAAVFGRIWRYCQMEDSVCFASQERIAGELYLNRSTVNQHIETLVTAGYLADTTPGVRNRPHVYADTGKAGLQSTITATHAQSPRGEPSGEPSAQASGGVGISNTSSPQVSEITTPAVGNSDTRCRENQHLGVGNSNMKKESLRESLRENEEIGSIDPEILWAQIDQQLRAEMSQASYAAWVQNLGPVTLYDSIIEITAFTERTRDWCQDRLALKISRLASAITGRELQIRFISPSSSSVSSAAKSFSLVNP